MSLSLDDITVGALLMDVWNNMGIIVSVHENDFEQFYCSVDWLTGNRKGTNTEVEIRMVQRYISRYIAYRESIK
jgi:hypothetical protein